MTSDSMRCGKTILCSRAPDCEVVSPDKPRNVPESNPNSEDESEDRGVA